ncbi:hypothetical protein PHET_04065 [Paragonimus heterotremus]|uniref:SEA domain-containing protein n=1 Tax=Paragonimus heterotremus TaxID=100268 RepID=A0A8J4SQY1_9TREM|nr:hypothetical protein PHET_04065 [Paragonimus heterotremus]
MPDLVEDTQCIRFWGQSVWSDMLLKFSEAAPKNFTVEKLTDLVVDGISHLVADISEKDKLVMDFRLTGGIMLSTTNPPVVFKQTFAITTRLLDGNQSLSWDPQLDDSESEMYKEKSTSVCEQMLKILEHSHGRTHKWKCHVKGFRQGSVVADVILEMESTTNETTTTSDIRDFLVNGSESYLNSTEASSNETMTFSLSPESMSVNGEHF